MGRGKGTPVLPTEWTNLANEPHLDHEVDENMPDFIFDNEPGSGDDLGGPNYDLEIEPAVTPGGPKEIGHEAEVNFGIKGEEIGIVVGIILLWIGAIALFFNRWGKIRMLEPYQPKFCEAEHRLSCSTVPESSIPLFPKSFSKLNFLTEENPHFAKCRGIGGAGGAAVGPLAMRTFGIPTSVLTSNASAMDRASRCRQNSIFTSTPHTGALCQFHRNNSSRRTKSTFDLPSLILSQEFFETLEKHKNKISNV